MRSLRHKLGFRRGDPDRHSFAFFVVATLVVIAVAFFSASRLGRYVEKGAGKEAGENRSRGTVGGERRADPHLRGDPEGHVGVFGGSGEGPWGGPSRGEAPDRRRRSEEDGVRGHLSRVALPEGSLPGTDGEEKGEGPGCRPFRGRKFMLQAGAMKTRETADALRKRLDRGGYKAKVIHATTRKHGECTASAWDRSDPARRPWRR